MNQDENRIAVCLRAQFFRYCAVLRQRGRHEDIMEACDRSLQLNPVDAEVYTIRGRALLELGCSDDALEALGSALQIKPDNVGAYDLYGAALLVSGELGAAERWYQYGARKYLNNSKIQCGFGVVRFRQGRHKEARQFLRSAVANDPTYVRATCYLDAGSSRIRRP